MNNKETKSNKYSFNILERTMINLLIGKDSNKSWSLDFLKGGQDNSM